MARTIVLAFGGNALCPEGCEGTHDEQRGHARDMAAVAGRLAAGGQRVVLTHGNGPQVGHLAIQQEDGAARVAGQPLFGLVAMTQGFLGHLVVLSLREGLAREVGEGGGVAAVVTHVVVDADDPAFADPQKPIGPFYDEAEARELAAARGWTVADVGDGRHRRVVASPAPREVLEMEVIAQLVRQGTTVVAAGGGGVPVVRGSDGRLAGVDAVVDKDLAAERMASSLEAEILVMVTGVPQVALDFGTPAQRAVDRLTVDEAARHLAAGQFPPGSMGPKVTAAVDFVKNGGQVAIITSAEHVEDAVAGRHGTRVVAA